MLELIWSITNGIKTKHNAHVETFSIIFSFKHGLHSEKVPHLAVNIFNNIDDQSLVNFKDANRENNAFMDQERFYWIRILKKNSEYFETSKDVNF